MNIKIYILDVISLLHLLNWVFYLWALFVAVAYQGLLFAFYVMYVFLPSCVIAIVIMIMYYVDYRSGKRSPTKKERIMLIFIGLSIGTMMLLLVFFRPIAG
jgi:hypothetical protein